MNRACHLYAIDIRGGSLCQLNCIRFTQLQSTHHYCGYTSHLCPHEELANGLGGSTTAPWLSVKGDPRVSGDTLGYWER